MAAACVTEDSTAMLGLFCRGSAVPSVGSVGKVPLLGVMTHPFDQLGASRSESQKEDPDEYARQHRGGNASPTGPAGQIWATE